MNESVVEFIKAFCEKVWFWLIVTIISICSLFSENLFLWLGFDENKRWIIGIIAIISLSLTIQHICDLINEYNKRRQIIKNIGNLPDLAKKELKGIVKNKKKTLKIKLRDNMEQRRIIEHLGLEEHNGYVTFPDYLWKELNLKFKDDKGSNGD